MSVQNFIPTLWSGSILRELEKNLVFGSVVNTDYQSLVKNQGDQVKINGIGPITVNTYSGSVTYESLEDSSMFLNLDQEKYFAFKVGDLDAVQASAPLIKGGTQEASYALADNVDTYLASLYSEAGITTGLGTDGTPIEINSSNVDTYLLKMARLMDDGNVTREGRWIIIPPWMNEDLAQSNINVSTDNVAELKNGVVGRYAGFDIRVSPNVSNTTSTKYKIMAGVNSAITFAKQINEIEAVRLPDEFSTGIRGLLNYGAKVQRPEALCLLTANEAAEA